MTDIPKPEPGGTESEGSPYSKGRWRDSFWEVPEWKLLKEKNKSLLETTRARQETTNLHIISFKHKMSQVQYVWLWSQLKKKKCRETVPCCTLRALEAATPEASTPMGSPAIWADRFLLSSTSLYIQTHRTATTWIKTSDAANSNAQPHSKRGHTSYSRSEFRLLRWVANSWYQGRGR